MAVKERTDHVPSLVPRVPLGWRRLPPAPEALDADDARSGTRAHLRFIVFSSAADANRAGPVRADFAIRLIIERR